MQATIDTFDERVGEIALYYEALKSLYDAKSLSNDGQKYFNDDFLKILKSRGVFLAPLSTSSNNLSSTSSTSKFHEIS